jgi:hypothetical protein
MDKTEFTQLAAAAAREGMRDFDWAVCTHIVSRQLNCSRYKAPDLDQYNPTAFYLAFETGGASGGDCWGDSARSYSTPVEGGDEFEALDQFLEEHFPKIPFLAYRKLMRQVEKFEYRDSDPYGNSTTYQVRALPFDALWRVLDDAGLLD